MGLYKSEKLILPSVIYLGFMLLLSLGVKKVAKAVSKEVHLKQKIDYFPLLSKSAVLTHLSTITESNNYRKKNQLEVPTNNFLKCFNNILY
jgi:hypothetical protein